MPSSTPIVDPLGALGAMGDDSDPYNKGFVNGTGTTGSTWSTTGNIYGAHFTGAANYTTTGVTLNTYDPNILPQDVILKRDGKPPLPVGKTLDAIMERLCIIEPAFEMMEKYPALKEAYEHYKMIEALIKNDPGNNT